MKKVIIAIGQLFGGGAERVVSIWSKELADAGYDVSILICGRGENEYEISSNVRVLSIVKNYSDYTKISYTKRFFRYRKILKNEKPDVVISFLPTTQIWCRFASIGLKHKRVETVRTNPWTVFKENKIALKLWKKCFKKADSIIVQTNEQIEFFSTKNQQKCVVIPNPISPKLIENNEKVFPTKICNFIASGRLVNQKNYHLTIRAFKLAHDKNPCINLSIFGKGNDQITNELKNLIKEEKLENVVFLKGHTSKIFDELKKAHAFLMTSDSEGLPNALIEAMTSKLICISTDCKTGPKDLIDHNFNGFLAKTGDINSIVDCILIASNLTSSEIEKMGNAAYKKINDFCSKEKSINKLVKLIESKK